MRIILEGCECTGKTTLAEKLAKKYNLKYIHITNKDENTYKFYKKTMKEDNVVFDRHFIGETIYPYVYERKSNLNKYKFEKLLTICKELNVKIFIMTASLKTIMERYLKRGRTKEEFITSRFAPINKMFLNIADKYKDNIFLINENTTEEEIMKKVEE